MRNCRFLLGGGLIALILFAPHIGLTQQAFAKKIGVRQQTVSDWEKGVNRPRGASLTLLNMIAEQAGFRYEIESQKK